MSSNISSFDMLSSTAAAWANATVYSAGDVVRYNGIDYYCDLGHTASMTITPTNTGYWSPLPYNYFAAGATTAGGKCFRKADVITFEAVGAVVSGAGTARVTIYGSNEPTPSSASWFSLDALNLTLGTVVTQDNGYHVYPTRWVKADVSNMAGTGISVSCYMASRTM